MRSRNLRMYDVDGKNMVFNVDLFKELFLVQIKKLNVKVYDYEQSIDISKTAWRKISFEEYDGVYSRSIYDNYQEMVNKLAEKEGLMPIEYDYLLWNDDIESQQ